MELKNVEIVSIGKLEQITDTFKKVSFRIKTEDQYPQEIEFQMSQDKADKFLQYNKVGQFVDIDFNLRGRSYLKAGEPEDSRRWFNTLDAWKVFKAEGYQAPTQEATEPSVVGVQEDDSLPF